MIRTDTNPILVKGQPPKTKYLVATDTNFTFGEIKLPDAEFIAPVFSKCFTEIKPLSGYRFIHDPESTDPENCVSVSVFNGEEAESTVCGNFAAVSDLTGVSVNLSMTAGEAMLQDIPYYHIIVPVVKVDDPTEIGFVVIAMTYLTEYTEGTPFYVPVDSYSDAEPTIAEPPTGGGGGDSGLSFATVEFILSENTENGYYYYLHLPYLDEETGNIVLGKQVDVVRGENKILKLPIPTDGSIVINVSEPDYYAIDGVFGLPVLTGDITFDTDTGRLIISGDGTFTGVGYNEYVPS